MNGTDGLRECSSGRYGSLSEVGSDTRPSKEFKSGGSSGTLPRLVTCGSRRVSLVRSSPCDSYGFTLRHFVFYPWQYNAQDPYQTVRPLDTVFVRHVKFNSAAFAAGLRKGDRVVSVNGVSALELCYADIVQLVRVSGVSLVLWVVSRNDDLLQRVFGETAHDPHSNLPMKSPFSHLPRPQPYRSSDTAVEPQSLPPVLEVPADGSSPRRTSVVSTLSLLQCTTAAANSFTSSPPRPTSSVNTDDPIYSRIRRNVDEKEQFLKRPSQPIWLPESSSQSAGTGLNAAITGEPTANTSVIREYHVNPSRLSRPLWPPDSTNSEILASGGSTTSLDRRPRRRRLNACGFSSGTGPSSSSFGSSTESLVSSCSVTTPTTVSVCSAAAASAGDLDSPYLINTTSTATTTEYVPYDTMTQVPRVKQPQQQQQQQQQSKSRTQLVSRRTRQFETGRLDNDVYHPPAGADYQSELTLLKTAKPASSGVRSRRTEFERNATASASRSKTATAHKPRKDDDDSDEETAAFLRTLRAGNRMVIVGGPRLHAEPLHFFPEKDLEESSASPVADFHHEKPSEDTADCSALARPLCIPTTNVESSNFTSPEPIAKKTEAPKRTESSRKKNREGVRRRKKADRESSTDSKSSSASSLELAASVAERLQPPGSDELSQRRPVRPNSLNVPSLLDSRNDVKDHSQEWCRRSLPLYSWIKSENSAGKSGQSSPTQKSSPFSIHSNVVHRAKQFFGEDAGDRCTRRVSYLKATTGGCVPSSGNEESKAGKLSVGFNTTRKLSELPPLGRIQKLRSFFEEKAQTHLKKFERTSSMRAKSMGPLSAQCDSSGAPLPEPTRQGWLHVKVAQQEGRRTTDRSWRHLWVVLRGNILSFHRDRKDIVQSPVSPDEQPVCVDSCTLDTSMDQTKRRRKNVFRLVTVAGSEYLLQAEHLLERQSWLQSLRPLCAHILDENNRTGNSGDSSSMLSPVAGKTMKKITGLYQRSPTTPSITVKPPKFTSAPVSIPVTDQCGSPKSKTWKGLMSRHLKRLHTNSPMAAANMATADGRTLDVPLELCPVSRVNSRLPALVEMCTSLVEKSGLDSVGIYRVPGNSAAILALSEAVNKDVLSVDLQSDPRWSDVNVVSSLLKSFFRRLPDSPVTSELYQQFIDASKIEDPERRKLQLRKLVNDMPDHNYRLLRHLFAHLRRVTANSAVNKMEPKNLAIVFGPTLVRSSDETTSSMVTDMSQQCRIVETLINEYDWFFPPISPVDTSPVDNVLSDSPSSCSSSPPPYPSHMLPASNIAASTSALPGSPSVPATAAAIGTGMTLANPASTHTSLKLKAIQRVDNDGVVGSDASNCSASGTSVSPSYSSGVISKYDVNQEDRHLVAVSSECNNNQAELERSCCCATDASVSSHSSICPAHIDPSPTHFFDSASSSHLLDTSSSVQSPDSGDSSAAVGGSLLTRISSLPGNSAADTQSPLDGISASHREQLRQRELNEQHWHVHRERVQHQWTRAHRALHQLDLLDELADHPADFQKQQQPQQQTTSSPTFGADSSSGYSSLCSAPTAIRRVTTANTTTVATATAAPPARIPQALVASSRFYRSPRPRRRHNHSTDGGAPHGDHHQQSQNRQQDEEKTRQRRLQLAQKGRSTELARTASLLTRGGVTTQNTSTSVSDTNDPTAVAARGVTASTERQADVGAIRKTTVPSSSPQPISHYTPTPSIVDTENQPSCDQSCNESGPSPSSSVSSSATVLKTTDSYRLHSPDSHQVENTEPPGGEHCNNSKNLPDLLPLAYRRWSGGVLRTKKRSEKSRIIGEEVCRNSGGGRAVSALRRRHTVGVGARRPHVPFRQQRHLHEARRPLSCLAALSLLPATVAVPVESRI